ncbi:MAG: sulfatase-like hydrolase/transferase [Akkermansia sp.]|nr:sulfatase-like hydrolase/transferase [Akkermansia sp.]
MSSQRIMKCGLIVLLSFVFTYALSSSSIFPSMFFGWYSAGVTSVAAFLLSFVFMLAMITLASCHRVISFIIIPVFLLLSCVCVAARVMYGTYAGELSIAMYNACWDEVVSYTDLRTVLLAALAFVVSFGVAWWMPKLAFYKTAKQKAIVVCLSLFALIATATAPYIFLYYKDCYHAHEHESTVTTFGNMRPFAEAQNFVICLFQYLNPPVLKDVATYESEVVVKTLPDVVVLYIREAYRADHSILNGYHRNTMPILSKMENIINLPFVHSKSTHTVGSIYSILSLSSPETGKTTHNSFLNILKKHNYANHLLVGANTGGKWYLSAQIAPLLNNQINLHSRPASPLEYEEAVSSIVNNKGSSPIFLLIEDGAGHRPYIAENDVFGSSKQVDKYDNCLIDVDARLGAIIRALKGKSAIMLFSSDHGESFGEGGRYGHAGPLSAKEQTHVCSLIWYSSKYATEHPGIVNNLKNNATLFSSHDYIYHTIISMAGLASQVQIQSQDMTKVQQVGSN